MGDHREFIRESIIRDMSEGVMTAGYAGRPDSGRQEADADGDDE